MSEMVERVARAINRFPFEALDACEYGEGHPHRQGLRRGCAAELERARAAIEAMNLDEISASLRDMAAFIRGDIAGPAQRDGILREADAIIDRLTHTR